MPHRIALRLRPGDKEGRAGSGERRPRLQVGTAAGPGGIVIEQFGALRLFAPATGTAKTVPVTLEGDLPEVRPHYVKVGPRIAAASISPNGARAVFEARGEILTVPAEKGDIRNLTRTTGVMEREPSWSPDGKSVAYFSDESGEYALHIRDQAGKEPAKRIGLGQPPSYFYRPVWSPVRQEDRLQRQAADTSGTSTSTRACRSKSTRPTTTIRWSPSSSAGPPTAAG